MLMHIADDVIETGASTGHLLYKPSQLEHTHWVHFSAEKCHAENQDIRGKWLVFRHYDELDETWEKIVMAIQRNELPGCVHAKCGTKRYHPSSVGPGPSTKTMICVFTDEHNMDDIGFKLVEIVQQDIKYKTNEDTLDYKYASSSGKLVLKTIFWNNGRPSFKCKDKPCYKTSFKREDIWHINVVVAPDPLGSLETQGRWILRLENEELTELWHILKDLIGVEEENPGIIKMVCPPKIQRNFHREQPVFHVYTSNRHSKHVGKQLINFVERNIKYECRPNHGQAQGFMKTLYWNGGEPDYEIVRRRGITKNWRTGEDII